MFIVNTMVRGSRGGLELGAGSVARVNKPNKPIKKKVNCGFLSF